MHASSKFINLVLVLALVATEINAASIQQRKKAAQKKRRRKTSTTEPPLRFFNELSKGLVNLFNPMQWVQQAEQRMSTESPDLVATDQPLVFNINDPNTGQNAEYTTGNAKVDRTIVQFFGTMTQIFDNMFKTFVTPTMNGTIWDDTPRPNGSGGLANFLSSFFCQIFLGLLSPNYNGKRCFVYRYPTTIATASTRRASANTVTEDEYNYE